MSYRSFNKWQTENFSQLSLVYDKYFLPGMTYLAKKNTLPAQLLSARGFKEHSAGIDFEEFNEFIFGLYVDADGSYSESDQDDSDYSEGDYCESDEINSNDSL